MDLCLMNQTGKMINVKSLLKFNNDLIIYNDKECKVDDVIAPLNEIISAITAENIAYHFIKDCYDDYNKSTVTLVFIWVKYPHKVLYLINWQSPKRIPELKLAMYNSVIPDVFYKFIIDDNWGRKLTKPLKYYNFEQAYHIYRKKLDNFYDEIKKNYDPYFKNFTAIK